MTSKDGWGLISFSLGEIGCLPHFFAWVSTLSLRLLRFN